MYEKLVDEALDELAEDSGSGAWLDQTDQLDLEEDMFDGLDAHRFEAYQEGESFQGKVPPIATDQVAAEIFAQALGTPGRAARLETAFGVGRQGVQADPTGQVRNIVDTQFIGRDRRRVNLEVDRGPKGSAGHVDKHLQAMRAAVRDVKHNQDLKATIEEEAKRKLGRTPTLDELKKFLVDSARSVFTTADRRGRIRDVRHVHYELSPKGRVVRRTDLQVRLNQPLTARQAWRLGVLDSPQAANQVAAKQEAARRQAEEARRRLARSPAPTMGRRRRNRFDAFDAFEDLDAFGL